MNTCHTRIHVYIKHVPIMFLYSISTNQYVQLLDCSGQNINKICQAKSFVLSIIKRISSYWHKLNGQILKYIFSLVIQISINYIHKPIKLYLTHKSSLQCGILYNPYWFRIYFKVFFRTQHRNCSPYKGMEAV